MINIFYNNSTLKDAMLISTSNLIVNKIQESQNFCLLFNDENLVGINIWNFNKYSKLKNGMIFPNQKILNLIFKITNIDLKKYYEPNFVVGRILKLEKITNTHLSYCDVDIKTKVLKIVCGASNVKENAKVIVAMVNTNMPDGKKILKTNIQQKDSNGMLCSEKELNIDMNNGVGIVILNDEYSVGETFVKHFANM